MTNVPKAYKLWALQMDDLIYPKIHITLGGMDG
jgi:hypothetical protein